MDARALHDGLLTLDSHIDTPWPDPPDPQRDGARHVDLPKMRRGGVWAGCFAAYVPQGPRDAEGIRAARARADALLDEIDRMADGPHAGDVTLAETAAEVRSAHAARRISILRAIENGQAIGDDLGLLGAYRARGVRYLTLVHNGHNLLADSANPRAELGDAAELHGGLSPLGREAVREMNRIGMLVDLSHLSRRAMLDAVAASERPTVATHSCAAALCPHPRNLDDAQLDALAATGGVIQITAMGPFLRSREAGGRATVKDFVDHIDHVVRRIGVPHVGIGSDFDGGGVIEGWRDASESPNLTVELDRRGYSANDVAAMWGGNFLRVLEAWES